MKKIDLDKLITEGRNINTKNIDKVSTLEMVKIINDEDKKVALAVEKELTAISNTIDKIVERVSSSGRIIYIGAGTSGRLGILDASECPPTFGVSSDLVQGIIAGGTEAIFKAKEGAEDSKELAIEDLKSKNISKNDVLIGIAASGRTPYVIGAIEYGNSIGSLTVGITCNKDSELSHICNMCISPIVGEEIISGSTRMKAGTAQKMVLNMISTGTMIKLGKVYENLMVDVKCTNKKLIERSIRIIIEATNVSRKEAENKLYLTNYNVKLAIFIILSGLNMKEAEKVLKENNGYIYKALNSIGIK